MYEQFYEHFLPVFFFVSGFGLPILILVACLALADKLSSGDKKDSNND